MTMKILLWSPEACPACPTLSYIFLLLPCDHSRELSSCHLDTLGVSPDQWCGWWRWRINRSCTGGMCEGDSLTAPHISQHLPGVRPWLSAQSQGYTTNTNIQTHNQTKYYIFLVCSPLGIYSVSSHLECSAAFTCTVFHTVVTWQNVM